MSKVQFLGQCPICNTRYNPDHSTVLERQDDAFTVYAECPQCKSSVVVMVLDGIRGIVTTMGMLTDLTREDLEQIHEYSRFTFDDVLEMHRGLERNRIMNHKS